MKKILLIIALLSLTGCAAGLFAEKTEVTLYNPKTGQMLGHVYSNKGYSNFKCKGVIKADGTEAFEWSAEKIDSNTVATETLKANQALTGVIGSLVGTAAAMPLK